MCVCAGQSQPFSRRTSSCQRSSTRQRLATFVLGFFHCFQIYTTYTGGDFPLGRLACHVQKARLDDQPVTGTTAHTVPSSHKQYCTVSAACFWRSCKNNNTPGQLHKCKLSGRVLRFLSGQTHHHCAQVIPVEDKRRRLNRWLGK